MDTRRDFIKKATLLSTGLMGILPESIQKAYAINPPAGTTYLDAEHVVILMQENRSFDHAYGTLQGVRGFDDPRAIDLPNRNKVWLQTNAKGETYAPFRLNIKDTKATWMSSLPHSWDNQIDARNNGRYDGWMEAKKSGNPAYAGMPLTLGYYDREDLPFYYALADAFTVCDQNFCSSLTGTTPNRLYLWSGTLRDPRNPKAMANVRNENVSYDKEASWMTFPERLEDMGVSWRIYQNEISLNTGLAGEEDSWLANFTDNPIEWFSQYRVRFHPAYHAFLKKELAALPNRIAQLEDKLADQQAGDPGYDKLKKELDRQKNWLKTVQNDLVEYAPEKFAALPEREKNLHQNAFTTNTGDPDYRSLISLTYQDGETQRQMRVPKGDVLHQFRSDVENNTLPAVSWIVAPENFSDHPGAPWYGAWYLSEVMDILTKDPEVWKKTIFILAYDENDGYFDHIPPFVPPHPDQPETGLTSHGIDTRSEFVSAAQESKRKNGGRTGPVGLGYRVPLVVASPWSRGGYVCSEVFDHTSVLQFLENFLSHKQGVPLVEQNISSWRRTICGDLTSVFRSYQGETIALPTFVRKEPFIEGIHKSQFKEVPSGFKALSSDEVAQANTRPVTAPHMPRQEKGTRPSCALPYELHADANWQQGKMVLQLSARKDAFGQKALGAPFQVYQLLENDVRVRSYAVAAGDTLVDSWEGEQHLRVYGPNGFYREFVGGSQQPAVRVACRSPLGSNRRPTGDVVVELVNQDPSRPFRVQITDNAYRSKPITVELAKAGTRGASRSVELDLKESHNWYDFSVAVAGFETFRHSYSGRVETGKNGWSDPQIGAARV